MKTDISPAPADLEAQIGMLSKKISASRFGKLRRAASLRTRRATLVLEDIFQPHNGAAVLRTADAFGLKEVHVIESRYKFRASAQVDTGASKWLEVHKYPCGDGRFPRNVKILKHSPLPKGCRENVAKALGEIRNMGYMLAASVPGEGSLTLQTLPLDRPIAVMIGTELTGLSDIAIESADVRFSVPMYGMAQSFNLSVFAGVCLGGICSRIRSREREFWALNRREELELLLSWLKKCVKNADEILGLA